MLADGSAPLLGNDLQKKSAPLQPCCRTNGRYQKSFESAKESMDKVFTAFGRKNRSGDSQASARRSLTVASVFCLLFMVAQAIGGYSAGSLAIMGDAAHLFSDFASLMVSLFSLCLAKRKASVNMTFGWHRAEVIGALISLCMIWGITAALVYVAVGRLRTFQFDINAELMLITASVGLCFNVIMALVLHKAGDLGKHGHSHGCASKHTAPENPESQIMTNKIPISATIGNKDQKSKHRLSVRAALLHVISDFMQSSAVFIAAVVIYCKPQFFFIDPMCTFLFSILVLLTTFPILKEITGILMEGAPSNIDLLTLVQSLRKLEGVERITHLRVWSLNTDRIACTVHIIADVAMHNWRSVSDNATQLLNERFHIDECTVQIVPLCDINLNLEDDYMNSCAEYVTLEH